MPGIVVQAFLSFPPGGGRGTLNCAPSTDAVAGNGQEARPPPS
jgi:hypothetical protein